MTDTITDQMPDLRPPTDFSTEDDGETGSSAPTLTEAEVSAMTEQSGPAPTMTPPATAATSGDASAGGVTATWRNNVHITALWSIEETRNAFVHVAGVGWRKIYNGRDGSFQALVTLASQARQTNRPVHLREEADGMIYAIYLW